MKKTFVVSVPTILDDDDDDEEDEEDDDEVEDNDKDDNNNKNISALGLDRDLGFSRGLQAQSSPHSEYYPYLCIPPKIPLPSYQLILHKLLVKQLSDPNCAPCRIHFRNL